MTRLLVSVRDVDEAAEALKAGVDLIDVKEPRRGSLGAVEPRVAARIAKQVAGRALTSVALGELTEFADLRAVAARGMGFQYAKCGLARCARLKDWETRLETLVAGLPAKTAAVAVVYADWSLADAPPPAEVLRVAGELPCAAVLVDTWSKQQGDLLTHWPLNRLSRFVAEVQARGMLMVLGGSLSRTTIPTVLPLKPDYVAVRGAVCREGRESGLDPRRTHELVELVSRCRLSA